MYRSSSSISLNFLFQTLLYLLIAGCTLPPQIETKNALIKDQRLSTDFTDEGVKIFYTLTGKLEKIEVAGQAEAKNGNVEAIAEADAMAKLVKFVYGNESTTDRKVKIIGRALEEFEKNQRSDDTFNTAAKELEESIKKDPKISNVSMQAAKVINETLTETTTTVTSRGKLIGVRKVRDYTKNSGNLYVAIYQWSEQDLATAEKVRDRMIGK